MKRLLALIALVIAGAIFMLYTRPAYDETRALRAKVSGYDSALERAAELQRLKQTLLSRYNAMDPVSLERLKKLLPDHVDNVRLILDLDTMASRHGMALENVAVGNEGEGTSQTAVATIDSGRAKYDSISLRFSTKGTYEDFRSFMEDLEASLRIVDVINLTIDRDGAVAAGGEPLYRFSITTRTYWLK